MGKLEKLIISTLESANEGLTLAEIAERIGEPEKKVFKALRKLFEKGLIDSENRRYRLLRGDISR
jgi:DNA-binding IclR family transcriptional regulator